MTRRCLSYVSHTHVCLTYACLSYMYMPVYHIHGFVTYACLSYTCMSAYDAMFIAEVSSFCVVLGRTCITHLSEAYHESIMIPLAHLDMAYTPPNLPVTSLQCSVVIVDFSQCIQHGSTAVEVHSYPYLVLQFFDRLPCRKCWLAVLVLEIDLVYLRSCATVGSPCRSVYESHAPIVETADVQLHICTTNSLQYRVVYCITCPAV